MQTHASMTFLPSGEEAKARPVTCHPAMQSPPLGPYSDSAAQTLPGFAYLPELRHRPSSRLSRQSCIKIYRAGQELAPTYFEARQSSCHFIWHSLHIALAA
eukprot:TRINITY_DN5000_c0_g1_i2.p1 TRINITY_DN5000_c0_g1~~TRINITY_DN5000_c0_g1_i2.p1  ORF type:complete len:101 (+),score=1.83 TRINITY_DN5000_c0_g1_i2:48-350(+)